MEYSNLTATLSLLNYVSHNPFRGSASVFGTQLIPANRNVCFIDQKKL